MHDTDTEKTMHEQYMEMAIREAARAMDEGEVPTGCVIVGSSKDNPERQVVLGRAPRAYDMNEVFPIRLVLPLRPPLRLFFPSDSFVRPVGPFLHPSVRPSDRSAPSYCFFRFVRSDRSSVQPYPLVPTVPIFPADHFLSGSTKFDYPTVPWFNFSQIVLASGGSWRLPFSTGRCRYV